MLLALLAPAAAPPPCTHANKQIALYLDYEYKAGEALSEVPATDISVGHFWNSTSAMRKFGANGVYAAQPLGFGDGVGGYFGSQSDGETGQGGLLFSIWDKARGKEELCNDPAKAPNATWCQHKHSFPLSDSCHRHCLDCGLPSKHNWKNTTGAQQPNQISVSLSRPDDPPPICTSTCSHRAAK